MGAGVTRRMTAWMRDPSNMARPNIIHADEGAKQYGFRRALVPGSIVYGWCVPAILDAVGEQWMHDGWASIRFRRPVHPGDDLLVTVTPEEEAWSLAVVGRGDERALVATLGLGKPRDGVLEGHVETTAREPVARPSAPPTLQLEQAPVGEELATLETVLPEDIVRPEEMTPQHSLAGLEIEHGACANPGAVFGRMSWYGHAVYDYGGPSIHTATDVKYARAARPAERVRISAVVKDAFERKGDHYIVYDGTIRDTRDEAIARVRHTTIFHVHRRTAT